MRYTVLRGDTMLELGQFIKEKRESAGLSQKALGEAAGISDSAVQRIESGSRKTPGWETLCKIAKALDFHPFEILQNAGYITVEDLKPYSQPVKGLGELNQAELRYVQLFADFIKANRQSDEKQ